MTKASILRYGTPEEAGMLPDRIERIKKLAEGWIAEGVTPSLVILAARKGIIFLHEAYGVLTPEKDSPPLPKDTIFPLGSLTKPVTATGAMILVEDGLLGLNRPVIDYIPEICGDGTEDVLVHHLLTHTSGFNEELLVEFMRKRIGDLSDYPPCENTQHPVIHEHLIRLYKAPLWKTPGEEMSYCNHNYRLLGEIIRRVSKKSLANFAGERIFNPLSMIDTNYILPESLMSRTIKRPPDAIGAQRVSRFYEGLNSRQYHEKPSGDDGVSSTAKDMAHFGQMYLNGGVYASNRVLSRPTISGMTRNQIPGVGAFWRGQYRSEANYGYGWCVQGNEKWKYYEGSVHSPSSFSHAGIGGVALWIDPIYEIVGAYFSVVLKATPQGDALWNFDLFQNAVTAALAE